MKPNHFFRQAATLIIIFLSVFFLENKRKANNSAAYKMRKEQSLEAKRMKVSNTDFIFFESLSKYLFIALVN